MSILAFNLMRGLQARVVERRRSNRKRRALHVYETIQTRRYRFINRAGRLVQPNGRATLDVGNSRSVRERFQAIEQALAARSIATLGLSVIYLKSLPRGFMLYFSMVVVS